MGYMRNLRHVGLFFVAIGNLGVNERVKFKCYTYTSCVAKDAFVVIETILICSLKCFYFSYSEFSLYVFPNFISFLSWSNLFSNFISKMEKGGFMGIIMVNNL